MEPNKQLLDKDGNPLTKKRIEEVMREVFKPTKPLLERIEWEEDGQMCHTWKINSPAGESRRATVGYTNDAGAAQINEAIRKMVMDETHTTETRDKPVE